MSMDDQFKKLDDDYWKTNIDLKQEIQKLKEQLADAEKVIDFYADENNYVKKQYDLDPTLLEKPEFLHGWYIGGKLAREYKSKYKVGEW